MRESVEVHKEARLSSLDQVSRGDIEHDDPGVRGGKFGRKFPIDIVAVRVEFGGTVGENEADGF